MASIIRGLAVMAALLSAMAFPLAAQTLRQAPTDSVVVRAPGEDFTLLVPQDWRSEPIQPPSQDKVQVVSGEWDGHGRPGLVTCGVRIAPEPLTVGLGQAAVDAIANSPHFATRMGRVLLGNYDGRVLSSSLTKIGDRPAALDTIMTQYEMQDTKVAEKTIYATFSRPGKMYVVGCGALGLTIEMAEASWRAWHDDIMAVLEQFRIDR